jgi:hypothetical protein
MQTNLNAATRHTVRMAATLHILAHGCTTSGWVKLRLQSQGYPVTEADVADWLFTVAQQEGWYYSDNSLFRLYYFPNHPASLN